MSRAKRTSVYDELPLFDAALPPEPTDAEKHAAAVADVAQRLLMVIGAVGGVRSLGVQYGGDYSERRGPGRLSARVLYVRPEFADVPDSVFYDALNQLRDSGAVRVTDRVITDHWVWVPAAVVSTDDHLLKPKKEDAA